MNYIVRLLSYRNILSIKSNDYTSRSISTVIFDYFLIEKGQESKYTSKWLELSTRKKVQLHNFSNSTTTYFLPLNRAYASWGHILFSSDDLIITQLNDTVIKINIISTDKAIIKIVKGGDVIFECTDTFFKLNYFNRTVGLTTYYINESNNKIILTSTRKNTKFIDPLKPKNKKAVKIITIDIETVNKDGRL